MRWLGFALIKEYFNIKASFNVIQNQFCYQTELN